MPGTILIGVDVETAGESSVNYARLGVEMLEAEGVCATWYVTGKTLAYCGDALREADRAACVEIQAHTYDHLLLKSVCIEIPPGRTYAGAAGWLFRRGGSPEQIDADLAKCQQTFADVLGREATALTGPWGYYRGLADRPDLLEIVYARGFRILRTFARNETDGEPIPLQWQPRFYEPQGFGDVLELMIHGYQDDSAFGWLTGGDRTDYAAFLREMADRVAAEDLVWGLCSHDHSCETPEAFVGKTSWLRETIRYARSLGIRFATASQLYTEKMAGRVEGSSRHEDT